MKPHCCNSNCNQGRTCPLIMPAEACTELGFDGHHTPLTWLEYLYMVLVVVAVVGLAIVSTALAVYA